MIIEPGRSFEFWDHFSVFQFLHILKDRQYIQRQWPIMHLLRGRHWNEEMHNIGGRTAQ
jgi:hypothetical protein